LKPLCRHSAGWWGLRHQEVVLGQVLAAHKAGNLDALLRRRPRATSW
jgi:hypothetical protein